MPLGGGVGAGAARGGGSSAGAPSAAPPSSRAAGSGSGRRGLSGAARPGARPGGGGGASFARPIAYLYTWKNAAKTNSMRPTQNSERFLKPVMAALYAAMLRNTRNAMSATMTQLTHLSDRSIVATRFGPRSFCILALRSDSRAMCIIM